MKIIVIAALLVITGCASSIMQGYVGKSISEPMMDYGVPVNSFDLPNGQRAFQWSSKETVVIHGASLSNSSFSANTNYAGNMATPDGYVSGSNFTSPSVIDENQCFYTLVADKAGNDWIVSGFRKPRFACE